MVAMKGRVMLSVDIDSSVAVATEMLQRQQVTQHTCAAEPRPTEMLQLQQVTHHTCAAEPRPVTRGKRTGAAAGKSVKQAARGGKGKTPQGDRH